MGIRCSTDPYGGVNPLIDKMIGNSYQTVKFVSGYCKEIRYVAEKMEDIYLVAKNMATVKENAVVKGTSGIAGSDTILPFPDQVDITKIVSTQVMIRSVLDGALYDSSHGYFTSRVASDGLHLLLSNTAPLSVQNSEIVWFIIHLSE